MNHPTPNDYIDRGERGIWMGMLRRCIPGLPGSEYHGDQGVAVCERWQTSFEAFLKDVGPRPSFEHSLDRWPDPYGDYEPGNTRWATAEQQRHNQRERVPGAGVVLRRPTPRPKGSRRPVFSALWQWMIKWRFTDLRLAAELTIRTKQKITSRQVANWRKGWGFPRKPIHLRAIDDLTDGEVTFQKMIDDKARADEFARSIPYADTLPNDLSHLPAERAFI